MFPSGDWVSIEYVHDTLTDDPSDPCEEYGHAWVGGMCVIHPEDLETIVSMRGADDIDCHRCGVTYAETL